MSEITRARVTDAMQRLRLGSIADRLDAVLADAARKEPTYLDFLDELLREELDAKQKRRVAMGIKIAHFPVVKTLEEFDFKFQPSLDAKLVRELATGHFIAQADNVLLFGPPGVGKTHVGIALGRAAIEAGHSVLFITATALLASLAKAHAEGHFGDQLTFFAKPKLIIVDELGYLPLERATANLFFQLVAKALRARQHPAHHQPASHRVGPRLRRRDHRRGDPRPLAPPQPHPGHQRRELSTESEEASRPSGPRHLNIRAEYFECRNRTTSWRRLTAVTRGAGRHRPTASVRYAIVPPCASHASRQSRTHTRWQ